MEKEPLYNRVHPDAIRQYDRQYEEALAARQAGEGEAKSFDDLETFGGYPLPSGEAAMRRQPEYKSGIPFYHQAHPNAEQEYEKELAARAALAGNDGSLDTETFSCYPIVVRSQVHTLTAQQPGGNTAVVAQPQQNGFNNVQGKNVQQVIASIYGPDEEEEATTGAVEPALPPDFADIPTSAELENAHAYLQFLGGMSPAAEEALAHAAQQTRLSTGALKVPRHKIPQILVAETELAIKNKSVDASKLEACIELLQSHGFAEAAVLLQKQLRSSTRRTDLKMLGDVGNMGRTGLGENL